MLVGTLTTPERPGPHPAAILIHGGNADERDCGHVGFPVFRLFAEHLQEQGIATLRYDDRGVGESGGGDKWDLLRAQAKLQDEGMMNSLKLLALQRKMHQETQTYTMMSNVMKCRHEMAKRAINNIG